MDVKLSGVMPGSSLEVFATSTDAFGVVVTEHAGTPAMTTSGILLPAAAVQELRKALNGATGQLSVATVDPRLVEAWQAEGRAKRELQVAERKVADLEAELEKTKRRVEGAAAEAQAAKRLIHRHRLDRFHVGQRVQWGDRVGTIDNGPYVGYAIRLANGSTSTASVRQLAPLQVLEPEPAEEAYTVELEEEALREAFGELGAPDTEELPTPPPGPWLGGGDTEEMSPQ